MNTAAKAREFLVGNPTEWLGTVDKLCSSVLLWSAAKLNVPARSLAEAQLAEILFAELTSPSLLNVLSGGTNAMEIHRSLVEALTERLRTVAVDIGESQDDFWGDIVDISDGMWESQPYIIRREWAGDAYWESAPILSEFQTLQLAIDPDELAKIVDGAMRDDTSKPHDGASLVRLDIIDLALYQTICQHPELLRVLDWRTFEKLLADVLESFGFEVELRRGTKDGGIDLFAIKTVHPLGPQRFLLQAKRWKNAVGIEPVRQLAFLHQYHRATKSCLATTATFTRGAWELAGQYRWQIELRDFDGLMEWVREAARLKIRV